MQFLPVGENHGDVVEGIRALGVTGQLGDLPGREVGENTAGQCPALRLQAFDLFRDVDAGVRAQEFEFFDLRLELCYRLLKFQKIHRHEELSSPRTSFREPYTKYQPSRPTKSVSLSSKPREARMDQASAKLTRPEYSGRF